MPDANSSKTCGRATPNTRDGVCSVNTATSISDLPDGVLLEFFLAWKDMELGLWDLVLDKPSPCYWNALTQVCRRWRNVIHASPVALGLHLFCRRGVRVKDVLDHSPPWPIFIDFCLDSDAPLLEPKDEDSVIYALRDPGRVQSVVLSVRRHFMNGLTLAMTEPLPILQYLELHTDHRDKVMLPDSYLGRSAHRLRHLTLDGFALPWIPPFLSSASNLVSVVLFQVPGDIYFSPERLVHVIALPRLQMLTLHFLSAPSRSIPTLPTPPNPTPVISLSLVELSYEGLSTYLEAVLARVFLPSLTTVDIRLFNQLTLRIPQISRLWGQLTESRNPRIIFRGGRVSIVGNTRPDEWTGAGFFVVQILCKSFDWQAHGVAQVCEQLIHTLSHIRHMYLSLPNDESIEDNDPAPALWRRLFGTFRGLESLFLAIDGARSDHNEPQSLHALRLSLVVAEQLLDVDILPALNRLIMSDGIKDECRTQVLEKFKPSITARERTQHTLIVEWGDLHLRCHPRLYNIVFASPYA
ncbi:hypothetical protein BC834DRAFT_281670 [Gloeopeniophorella convolvens]|nr:hypothetical protein BC834DRAFT_281670 [Gloeopeniophorella convolvens]